MTVQAPDAHALIPVVKMATMFEESITEKQRSVVRFVSTKGLNAKDIPKKMFPVYGRKCLMRKTVHNWVEKRSKRFAEEEEVETEVRKWLREQSKRLVCCGFRRTGKAMEHVCQCWCRICGEINVFFLKFEYQMLYVLYPFETYTDSPSYIQAHVTSNNYN
jgi:hypothetical protein